MLSRNKHIQDKVYDEIKDVFGDDKSNPITYHQLLELKYMELVLKETMRLHPAVQIIGRNVDRDLKLGKYHGFFLYEKLNFIRFFVIYF